MSEQDIYALVCAILIIRGIVAIVRDDIFVDYSNKQDVEDYERRRDGRR